MSKSPSFLKHALIYGVGHLLVSASGFVLLPLYLPSLSEAEFGTLDFLNRLSEAVLLFLLIKGLRQGLFSFHNLARDDRERRAVVGSALFLLLLFLGSGGLVVCLFAEPVCAHFHLGAPHLLLLAVVGLLLEALVTLLLGLAQARVESAFFTAVNF